MSGSPGLSGSARPEGEPSGQVPSPPKHLRLFFGRSPGWGQGGPVSCDRGQTPLRPRIESMSAGVFRGALGRGRRRGAPRWRVLRRPSAATTGGFRPSSPGTARRSVLAPHSGAGGGRAHSARTLTPPSCAGVYPTRARARRGRLPRCVGTNGPPASVWPKERGRRPRPVRDRHRRRPRVPACHNCRSRCAAATAGAVRSRRLPRGRPEPSLGRRASQPAHSPAGRSAGPTPQRLARRPISWGGITGCLREGAKSYA